MWGEREREREGEGGRKETSRDRAVMKGEEKDGCDEGNNVVIMMLTAEDGGAESNGDGSPNSDLQSPFCEGRQAGRKDGRKEG